MQRNHGRASADRIGMGSPRCKRQIVPVLKVEDELPLSALLRIVRLCPGADRLFMLFWWGLRALTKAKKSLRSCGSLGHNKQAM